MILKCNENYRKDNFDDELTIGKEYRLLSFYVEEDDYYFVVENNHGEELAYGSFLFDIVDDEGEHLPPFEDWD